MKTVKTLFIFLIPVLILSCGSIKSTLRNIDDTAIKPTMKDNAFVLTEYSTDKKYGYNKDYPINLGFEQEKQAEKNVAYFFNALSGKNGEKITYIKLQSCCPFPTKRNRMGAGSLDVYEVTFEGSNKKIQLYINIYEPGKVLCPVGFSIKN